jgi:hypothetical protein
MRGITRRVSVLIASKHADEGNAGGQVGLNRGFQIHARLA